MIIALIGARSGSKGVPNKNIRILGGYPLLAWSIRACAKAKLIDRIIVSTDSEEYASIARLYGAEVIMRPAAISGDESTDYEFIAHALETVDCEYVAHIRPTTPLRDPQVIDRAITEFQATKDYAAMRSVHEMPESAYKAFTILAGVLVPMTGVHTADMSNLPRQSFPTTYAANGYVDVLNTKFCRHSSRLHGDSVCPFLTEPVIEIDCAADFAMLEAYVSRNPEVTTRVFGSEIYR